MRYLTLPRIAAAVVATVALLNNAGCTEADRAELRDRAERVFDAAAEAGRAQAEREAEDAARARLPAEVQE